MKYAAVPVGNEMEWSFPLEMFFFFALLRESSETISLCHFFLFHTITMLLEEIHDSETVLSTKNFSNGIH